MGKNLKKLLLQFYNNFEKYGAYEINEYFNCDFGDDYDEFELDENNIEALSYLNDEFIDIDIDHYNSDEFDIKVKKALKKALELIKS